MYSACAEIDISEKSSPPPAVSFDDSLPLNQRAVQSQLDNQFEVFELGTGTAAPPSVTATKATPQITPSSTTFATSTVSEVDECSGLLTTVYVPSATVTVTVTAAGPTV